MSKDTVEIASYWIIQNHLETNMNDINIQSEISISIPIVTKRLFSKMSGLSEDSIRGMISRGYLPTIKVGRHRLINLAQLNKEALLDKK